MIRVRTDRVELQVAEVPQSRAALVLGGLSALRANPSAGLLVGLFGLQTLVRGILNVLLVVAAVELLGMGEQGAGYLSSAIGAGGFIGAVLGIALTARRDLAGPVAFGLVLWGAPITLTGLVPLPWAALSFLVALGVGNAVLDISGFTLLQRSVPNAVRARVFGVLEAAVMLTLGLGAALAPVLIGLLGIQGALVVTGLILPLAALGTWRWVADADAQAVVPTRELRRLSAVPMFAPLPLTILEQLAGGMQRLTAPAGTMVIRQGEKGDRFYIVDQGQAQIRIDGAEVNVLGPGDCFGEIALLRDIPRIADVVAAEDLELYSLDRELFLATVSGNPTSATAADTLVETRLPPASSREQSEPADPA
jgi:hypothetical protein